MVIYNESIPNVECQSSVYLVVIERHICIWLIEDSVCTLTILKQHCEGVPAEDVAMLNVSGSRTPWTKKEYTNLSNL